MPILVYCAYCGQVIARYRTLIMLSEVERRTLQKYSRCPHCGSAFTKLDVENIVYEIRRTRTRRKTRRARRARARSVRVV